MQVKLQIVCFNKICNLTSHFLSFKMTHQTVLNRGLAQMLKGGVIMDVTTAEQARLAERSGAVAVMALERVPADIRAEGGVARMSDPEMIKAIKASVSIPVMAKVRIGHFIEAQVPGLKQNSVLEGSGRCCKSWR
jgi:pyridoxal 5'-phosphate synthase pdxS subunit